MSGSRPADTLWLDAAGELHGHFPPGPHVYPIAEADVLALAAAVRAATTDHRVIPGATGAPRWAGDLERFIRRRLPAVVAALTADGTLAATTAARAGAKAAALEALGAPAAVVDPVRRHAAPRPFPAGVPASTRRRSFPTRPGSPRSSTSTGGRRTRRT
ncbi:hypothetical protein AB0H83_19255 [Dactylosporangium sp. NPDC050688]|uniref:hypothetical protein n=1 Tax=Dactylosporangium sp. NPDC050688 TaxID=3157217 RepID=UPI0033EB66B2